MGKFKYLDTLTLCGMVFAFVGMIFVIVSVFLKSEPMFYWIFFGMGALFVLVGIVMIAVRLRHDAQSRELMEQNEYVLANVSEIAWDYNETVNGKHPQYIKCTYMNPETGLMETFRSENVYDVDFNELRKPLVKVYLDRNNHRKYYVDLNSLQ